MEEQFVTYEIALALKEIGFDEPCLGYYDEGKEWFHLMETNNSFHPNKSSWAISAPIWQQAVYWLFKRLVELKPEYRLASLVLFDDTSGHMGDENDDWIFDFDNLEEGMLKAIKIIKKGGQ